jgi:hypothetical protein
MTRLRIRSIRTRLLLILLASSIGALLLACVAIIGFQLDTTKRELVSDLTSLADVVGATSTAAVSFGDHAAAVEMVSALARNPHVDAAALYDQAGAALAGYRRAGSHAPSLEARPTGSHGPTDFTIVRPIVLDGHRIGTIALIHRRPDPDLLCGGGPAVVGAAAAQDQRSDPRAGPHRRSRL